MGDKTGISWTDATWNPIVGCSVVSPGCKNCYAMQWAHRMLDKPDSHYEGTTRLVNGKAVWTGKINLAPVRILTQPIKWKRPRRIFVNSMSDLFHEDVPDEWIDQVFAVMAVTRRHTYQILTKRPERMLAYCKALGTKAGFARLEAQARTVGYTLVFQGLPLLPWPIPNVWLGVSAEDQARWDERVPLLADTPAALRFVSVEPQVGPIVPHNLKESGIDWLIVGGESGPDARPFHMEWAVTIEAACAEAGTAFFMKQAGSNAFIHNRPAGLRHRKGEAMDEWPLRLQWQEFPKGVIL